MILFISADSIKVSKFDRKFFILYDKSGYLHKKVLLWCVLPSWLEL